MDGIKPTLSDLNDDTTATSGPVLVDLAHQAEHPDVPAVAAVAPTAPVKSAPQSNSPRPAPAASPRIAPITPPYRAEPESNVEMVPAPNPDPITAPVPTPVAAPAPTPKAAEPSGVYAVTRQPAKRKPMVIGLIILLALLLIGGGAAYYFLVVKPNATTSTTPAIVALDATAPTKLIQQSTSGAIKAGDALNVAPSFSVTLPTTANSGNAAAEVEVQLLTVPFVGTPSTSGQAVSANGHDLTLPVSLTAVLPDGSYHWQARTKVGTVSSAWVPYAATGVTTADFVVTTVAPAVPTLSQISSGKVTGMAATTTVNQPQLSGTTVPASTLAITVTPDNITLTPTIAADGTWTATPAQQLANGAHTITFVTVDRLGNRSQSVYSLAINPAVAVAAVAPKLAATGDATSLLTLLALLAGASSIFALVYLRRYDRG